MSFKKYAVYNLDESGRNHSAEYFDKNFTLHGCIDLVKNTCVFTTDTYTKIATKNLLKYDRQIVYNGVA